MAWSSHRVHRQLHRVVRGTVRCDREEQSEPWPRGSVRVLRPAGEPQNLTPAVGLLNIDILTKGSQISAPVSEKICSLKKETNKQTNTRHPQVGKTIYCSWFLPSFTFMKIPSPKFD